MTLALIKPSLVKMSGTVVDYKIQPSLPRDHTQSKCEKKKRKNACHKFKVINNLTKSEAVLKRSSPFKCAPRSSVPAYKGESATIHGKSFSGFKVKIIIKQLFIQTVTQSGTAPVSPSKTHPSLRFAKRQMFPT